MIRKTAPLEVTTIYETLRYWRDAEAGELSPKQRGWCECWERLENPSAAGVARELNISKQASAAMLRRIVAKLLSAMQRHARENRGDFELDRTAAAKQERIEARPEYLELSERRGKLRRIHFQAGGGFDERLGRETVSGYHFREVSEAEAAALQARGVPVVRRRWKIHKESPLARWWIARARELQKERGIKYTDALQELRRLYAAARPQAEKGATRCIVCRQPLPWGETIPGSGMGRITARREFCSNFCRITFKRTRR